MNICYKQYYERLLKVLMTKKLLQKVTKKGIEKQYFKWKGYDKHFNSRINKSNFI